MPDSNVATARALRVAREELIQRGLVGDRVPPVALGVRAPIERSWRRSMGLQAAASAASTHFINRIDPQHPLLRAARVVLDRWQESLSGMRIALFLSDKGGQIVARRVTDSGDMRRLDRAFAAEGFDFSESALGTNGLGTAMEDRKPVFIRGGEHFNESLETLACAGAPIRHPITGKVTGSIAFASLVGSASPLMLAMAQQAARQVEEQLAETASSRDLAATMTFLRQRSTRNPIVVLSEETILANIHGLPYISAQAHAVLWERLLSLDWTATSNVVDLPDMPHHAIAHRLNSDATAGTVFALEVPVQRTSQRGDRSVVDRVEPLLDDARLEELARPTRTLVLAGPGGAGKAHLAADWLARRSRGERPLVLDAADLAAGLEADWTSASSAALDHGRSILVRHLEDLPPAAFTTVKSLARRLREGAARPDAPMATDAARLVLTVNDALAPSPILAFASQLAPALSVPPLAARKDRLPRLIRELVDEHPVEDRVTLSPAAMQAFLRWDWPGNVSELRTLLDVLCATLPGQAVQLSELPEAIQAKVRNMTRIEALERDAILSALRHCGGNRSAAASELGIGRTTLYRKLTALGIAGGDRMIS